MVLASDSMISSLEISPVGTLYVYCIEYSVPSSLPITLRTISFRSDIVVPNSQILDKLTQDLMLV